MIIASATGRTIRGLSGTLDGSFVVSPVNRVTPISGGTDSYRTVNDLSYHDVGGGIVDRVQDLVLTSVSEGFFQNHSIQFSSLDPAIATIDHMGIVTRVSDGTARLRAAVNNTYIRQFNISVVRNAGDSVTTTFNGFTSGSLAKHINDQIDSRIVGKNITDNGNVYSTQNHDTATYVRDPNFWAADIDLTCASPWNSSGGRFKAGTLVTPRHIVLAKHYGNYVVGQEYRFVKADGTVVTRTVTAYYDDPSSIIDITIGKLDSDVPAGISFAKVMPPATFLTKAPAFNRAFGDKGQAPALVLNQMERGSISDFAPVLGNLDWAYGYPTDDDARSVFWGEPILGDSGNPSFLLVNNQPVLLTTWTSGGFGNGPNYCRASIQAAVNAGLTSLGGGYQLTTVDLSGFPSY